MAAQDSTKNYLNNLELKQTYKLLSELQFRRLEVNLLRDQISIKSEIIQRKDYQIQLKEKIEKNLREQLEIVKPAWYDSFYVGAGAGIVIVTTIVFLVK